MYKDLLVKSKDFLKFTWKRIKERKFYLLILVLFFAYIVIMSKPFDTAKDIYREYNVENFWMASDEFLAGEIVKQTFVAKDNNLQCIGINGLALGRKLGSNIKVIITEVETGKEILNQDINLLTFTDGYLPVNIENQPNSKGKEYSIELQSLDAVPGNGLVFWRALNDENSGEKYFENGNEVKDNRLMLSYTYYKSGVKLFYLFLWALVFAISLIFVIYILDDNADEKTFLKIALCIGVFYIFFTPMAHPLDEASHMFKAMIISKGQPYVTVTDDGTITGRVPENYGRYIIGNNMTLRSIVSGEIKLNEAFKDGRDTTMIYSYFSTTLPTGHLIPAMGIFVGNLINLPAVIVLYIARAITYAFYVCITYLAIKNMKYYKSTMLAIALIPVSFWISGTVSLDPILNSSAFLFISICLKYFYMDKNEEGFIKVWELIALIIAAIMIVTCKYLVYTPIVLLFFLIPKDRFKTKKSYITMIIVSIIVGILTLAWQFWILAEIPYVEDRNGHTSMEEQIEFILDGNLVNTGIMFLNIIIVVTSLGHLNMYFKTLFPTLAKNIGIVLFFAAILDKNKYTKDSKKKNITTILLASLYAFVLFIALLAIYITFTQVGANHVQGYQIRYTTIIAPLLLIPIANMFVIKNDTKNYNMMLIFTMVLFNLDQILALLIESFK